MGNCFVKHEPSPNKSPAIYPDAHAPFSSSEATFPPPKTYETHVSSSKAAINGGTCSSNRDMSVPCSCSVNYTQINHDSVVMKTGGSVKEQSCKLAHLLEKSFVENGDHHPPMELVTARINPTLLTKSSGKKNGVVGLEDPVHSKSESPRTKLVGLIVKQLAKSMSSARSNSVKCSGSCKVDNFNSDMIFHGKARVGISGCRIPKESPNLSSIFSRINLERNCPSLSSGLCRSCNLAVEGEKAFGSPLSIESNNLWERTRECSPFDEFSDSSSDLFDIDFLKPTYYRGLCRSCNIAVEGEKAFGSPMSIESNNLWEMTRECSPFDEFSDSSSDLFDIDF